MSEEMIKECDLAPEKALLSALEITDDIVMSVKPPLRVFKLFANGEVVDVC